MLVDKSPGGFWINSTSLELGSTPLNCCTHSVVDVDELDERQRLERWDITTTRRDMCREMWIDITKGSTKAGLVPFVFVCVCVLCDCACVCKRCRFIHSTLAFNDRPPPVPWRNARGRLAPYQHVASWGAWRLITGKTDVRPLPDTVPRRSRATRTAAPAVTGASERSGASVTLRASPRRRTSSASLGSLAPRRRQLTGGPSPVGRPRRRRLLHGRTCRRRRRR